MDRIVPASSSLLVVDALQGFSELRPDELPVPGALALVPKINTLLSLPWSRIDASQDWHPPDHRSFLGRADHIYPPHCIRGTPGAEFLPGLDTFQFHTIWRKGFHADFEAYAVTAQHPGFIPMLRASGVDTVALCGTATNICIFFAARDLRQAGFRAVIVEDASAGIDVPAAGLFQDQTRREGQALGIEYVTLEELLEAFQGAGKGIQEKTS